MEPLFLKLTPRQASNTIWINAAMIVAIADNRADPCCTPSFEFTTITTTNGRFEVQETEFEILSNIDFIQRQSSQAVFPYDYEQQ